MSTVSIEIPSTDAESNVLTAAGRSTFLLSFLTILAVETFGFFTLRSTIAQSLGQSLIVIDLGSIIVLFLGAGTLSYLYYTRYVRRQLIFTNNSVCLRIGKRDFEYKWKEFKIVALSIASSHVGAKGFSIRIYPEELEGEYVELPIYKFSKDIDVFELRANIEQKIMAND